MIKIKEIIDEIIKEEYPVSFDIEDFKSLKHFTERIKYCEDHLQKIASGSGRIVFKIDNEKVLKLAKNRKGISQNEAEVDQGNDYYLKGTIAEIYDNHPDFFWVEMELCKKITKQRFENIIGISFSDFVSIVQYENQDQYSGYYRPSKPTISPDVYWENEFVSGIIDYIKNYDIPMGDLTRLSTYGENSKGDVVIVDYGLTSEVFKKHYSRKK